MKFTKSTLTLLLIAFLFTINGNCQTITGQVTDSITNIPLIGASIMVKGVTRETVTDSVGNYKLRIDSTCKILVFSHVNNPNLS